MALDSAIKRRSSMMMGLPFRPILPDPSGAVGQEARQVFIYLSSAILSEEGEGGEGTPAVDNVPVSRRQKMRFGHRREMIKRFQYA